MNKFKYVLNIIDEKEYGDNKNLQRVKSDNFISKESNNDIQLNKISNNNQIKDNKEEANRNQKMKIIHELIENSMNNDNLKKKTIDYEAWF